MRYILILISLVFLSGCYTTCPPCPPERAYFITPYNSWLYLDKGAFDDKEGWLTEDEWQEYLKAAEELMKKWKEKEGTI